MQIDGHHTATYVAARIAGFSFADAEKIAYAAQYVDDATNAGTIQFDSSDFLYERIASAHKMIDYNNFIDVENHLAWMPFHFLPGNGGLTADMSPTGGEVGKLICRPDSPIARDMLRKAMLDRDNARGLHRLGIAMHVYADTFAHQGFVGSQSLANQTQGLTSGDPALDAAIKAATKKELWAAVKGQVKAVCQVLIRAVKLMIAEHRWPGDFINRFLKKSPVGHAAADVFPDQPYLVWRYVGFDGVPVERNNPENFLQAVDMMVRAMRAWIANDGSMNLEVHEGLDAANRAVVERLFRTTTMIDGEERRQAWLAAIKDGEFTFGSEVPTYVGKGAGSWKATALNTLETTDSGFERFPYSPEFLKSDWKHFHDALQIHRSDVVREVLPQYGICAA